MLRRDLLRGMLAAATAPLVFTPAGRWWSPEARTFVAGAGGLVRVEFSSARGRVLGAMLLKPTNQWQQFVEPAPYLREWGHGSILGQALRVRVQPAGSPILVNGLTVEGPEIGSITVGGVGSGTPMVFCSARRVGAGQEPLGWP